MQRKPRFSGILLVAVLMVVVLLFVSLSPLVAASASKHVNYSDIYYYFQNQPGDLLPAGPQHQRPGDVA